MYIKIWARGIREKIQEAIQSRREQKIFRRILLCTNVCSRQELREEADYIRALAEKAYYEKKISYQGYRMILISLEVAEKSILKSIIRTGLQAAS